ncbi:MAG: hypothetical protein ACLUSP_08960 [Christensenellales bacterium]
MQGFTIAGTEDVSLAFDDNVQISDDKYSEKSHFDYNDLADIRRLCRFFIINIYKRRPRRISTNSART